MPKTYWITAEITRRAFLTREAEDRDEARATAEQLLEMRPGRRQSSCLRKGPLRAGRKMYPRSLWRRFLTNRPNPWNVLVRSRRVNHDQR